MVSSPPCLFHFGAPSGLYHPHVGSFGDGRPPLFWCGWRHDGPGQVGLETASEQAHQVDPRLKYAPGEADDCVLHKEPVEKTTN